MKCEGLCVLIWWQKCTFRISDPPFCSFLLIFDLYDPIKTQFLLIFAHFCLIFGQFFTLGFSNCYWSVKLSYRYISYNHLYQFVVIRSVKKPGISHIAAFSPEKRWILSSVGPVDLFWPALFEFWKNQFFWLFCVIYTKKILYPLESEIFTSTSHP